MRTVGLVVAVGLTACVFGARPFAVDDAGTVAANGFELEAGVDYWEEDLELTLGFKHGLTDRMDIGIGLEYLLKPEQTEGFGPAELSFKYAPMPELLAASVAGGFGGTEYDLNGIVSRSFGPFELNVNFGYAATGTNNAAGSITYGAALIFGAGRIGAGVEAGGDKDGMQVWQCGVRYAVVEGLAVDAGFSGGFGDDDGNQATTGLHYEF